MRFFPMHVHGAGHDAMSGEVLDSVDPFTVQPWAQIPQATQVDVDEAVRSAQAAFTGEWGGFSPLQRSHLMRRLADAIRDQAPLLAELETSDNGKLIRESQVQMVGAARVIEYFAGACDKVEGRAIPLDAPNVHSYTERRPYGPTALITPWNSPVSLLATKLGPVLATGNTAVVKPSEFASATTCRVAEIATEVGFPPGVVNVVTGTGAVGRWLVEHPLIRKISFTGGAAAAAAIGRAAAERAVPLTLELGGKSANVVFDDADIDRAVVGVLAGIFGGGGQSCIAGSRLVVHEAVLDEVVGRVAERASTIRMGDPRRPDTELGPMAHRGHFDHVRAMIVAAEEAGVPVICRGGRGDAAELERGLFVRPTIVGPVSDDAAIAQEEVFGPVLAVLPFATEDEGIRIANATRYGLATGVWTRSLSRAMRVSRRVESGHVWVNTYRYNAAQVPFGGIRASGYGRERGMDSIDEYTYSKSYMLDFADDEARDPFTIKA